MAGGIKIAEIYADLKLDSGHLDRGIANARVAMKGAQDEIKLLDTLFDQGKIHIDAYNDRVGVLALTMNRLEAGMTTAYSGLKATNGGLDIITANAGRAGGAMGNAASQGRHFGMAMMNLSSVIDDVQYGFQGIVNNIGPLVTGLSGGNMVLGAAAQVAAVGIYQLYAHWNQLIAAISGAFAIKTASVEMEELGKKTALTANEQDRLNKLKRDESTEKSIFNERTGAQEKSAKAIKDVIAEFGDEKTGKTGARRIWEAIAPEMKRGLTPEEEKTIERNESRMEMASGAGALGEPARKLFEERNKEIRRVAQARDDEAAENFMAKAVNDRIEREDLIRRIQKNPEKFGGEQAAKQLTRDIEAASPEGVRQKASEKVQEKVKDLWEKFALHVEGKAKTEAAREDREDIKSGKEGRDFGKGDVRDQLLHDINAKIRDEVLEQLVGSGWSRKDALEHVGDVMKQVRENAKEDIAKKAQQMGGGTTPGEAARELLREEAEKEQAEKDRNVAAAQQALKARREAEDKVEDSETTLRRSRYKLEDLIKEHNKPKFEGYEEYAKKLALGGFDTENYQRKIFEANEDIKKNTREAAQALTDLKRLMGLKP